ncbi:hypothetical protein [Caldithrix abyssi]
MIQSGQPISTEKTCSACHDYEFITIHSDHAQQGKNEFFMDETRPKNFADFVLSPGMFAMSSLRTLKIFNKKLGVTLRFLGALCG